MCGLYYIIAITTDTKNKEKCKIAERMLDASAWGELTNSSHLAWVRDQERR